jgi:hypothetical protein
MRISIKQLAFINQIIEQCGLKDAQMCNILADMILNSDNNKQEQKLNFISS